VEVQEVCVRQFTKGERQAQSSYSGKPSAVMISDTTAAYVTRTNVQLIRPGLGCSAWVLFFFAMRFSPR
jgi:hypothetical protein